MEQVFFVLAIVSFALAAVAAIVAALVFVRGDVPNAIRFLRHKPTKGRNKTARKAAKARVAKASSESNPVGKHQRNGAVFAPGSADSKTDEIDGVTADIDGATDVVAPTPDVPGGVGTGTRRFESFSTAEESEQPTGLLPEEDSEADTGILIDEESEQPTGILVEDESEQPTGMLAEEDSEGETGFLGVEESEQPTGILELEASEQPTGILVEEDSERPTGILAEESEQPTGILQVKQAAEQSGGMPESAQQVVADSGDDAQVQVKTSGVVQQEDSSFRFILRVDEVVVHTDEVIV